MFSYNVCTKTIITLGTDIDIYNYVYIHMYVYIGRQGRSFAPGGPYAILLGALM